MPLVPLATHSRKLFVVSEWRYPNGADGADSAGEVSADSAVSAGETMQIVKIAGGFAALSLPNPKFQDFQLSCSRHAQKGEFR